jgi:hypothetical protein
MSAQQPSPIAKLLSGITPEDFWRHQQEAATPGTKGWYAKLHWVRYSIARGRDFRDLMSRLPAAEIDGLLHKELINSAWLAGFAKERSLKKRYLAEARRAGAAAAAQARHAQPGGYRDKKAAVLRAWASGTYRTKDACADALYRKLGLSWITVRDYLKGA